MKDLIRLKILTYSNLNTEFAKNKRFHWMMVILLAVALLSLSKSLRDHTFNLNREVLAKMTHLAKLQNSASVHVEDDYISEIKSELKSLREQIPSAPSGSIAQAIALSNIEKKFEGLASEKRLNLVGMEKVMVNDEIYWNIRIEIIGKLDNNRVVDFLDEFDFEETSTRIVSYNHSPDRLFYLNVVADFLFYESTQK